MRLANVSVGGVARYGAITEDGFIDLGLFFGGRCQCLADILTDDLLAEARAAQKEAAASAIPLDAIRYLPALPGKASRVIAIGWAYGEHQREVGREPSPFPSIFPKFQESFVGHGETLAAPHISDMYDFEGEVALVIGKGGRDIPAARGCEHIAGYTIVMDGSVRDWQQHSVPAGKNFEKSSAIGPWITTADEIERPGDMRLSTRLNGQLMQQADFREMVWDPGYLVHYLSTIFALRPGDIVSTGTPAGVGHKRRPPVFMKTGDVIEVDVEGIGTLRNPIERSAAA